MADLKVLSTRTWRALTCQLRFLCSLQLITGIVMIVFAIVLQWPPGDALTIGLWVVGGFAVCTSLLGFIGSLQGRCCLGIYCVMGVLATLGQAGLMLYLMIAPEDAVEKLQSYQRLNNESARENLPKIVNIARWVLLGLVGAQSIAVVVALVARCVMKRHRHYEEYEEEQQVNKRKKAAAEMDDLKQKIGADFGQSSKSVTGTDHFSIAAARSAQDATTSARDGASAMDPEQGAGRPDPLEIWPSTAAPEVHHVKATWAKAVQKRAMEDHV